MVGREVPGAALQGVGANLNTFDRRYPFPRITSLSSLGPDGLGMLFGITEHSITRHRISESDYSIDVSALVHVRVRSDEDREMICASFTCPYCWREGDLIDAVQSGEQIVVACKRTSREFAVRFDGPGHSPLQTDAG